MTTIPFSKTTASESESPERSVPGNLPAAVIRLERCQGRVAESGPNVAPGDVATVHLVERMVAIDVTSARPGQIALGEDESGRVLGSNGTPYNSETCGKRKWE
jgi:hypothetical protein